MDVARNVEGLPGWALELLRVARVGHLGLIDDQGRPRVLPVTFALMAAGSLRPGDVTTSLGDLDDAPRALREHVLGDETKTILVEDSR